MTKNRVNDAIDLIVGLFALLVGLAAAGSLVLFGVLSLLGH
jgi:hypothetical protein